MQRCPICDCPVRPDAINIQEGVALCSDCGQAIRLSELLLDERTTTEIVNRPPHGCAIEVLGRRVKLTVSLRSIKGVAVSVGVAIFWNFLVIIFGCVAAAGFYQNLVGPLPAWFPAPELEAKNMTLGMSLFMCLFLTPFLLIGIGLMWNALQRLVGSIEIVIDEFDSYVATGIGFVRWTSRFDPRQMRSVNAGGTSWFSTSEDTRVIEIKADRTIQLDMLLPGERLDWLNVTLREVLLNAGYKFNPKAGLDLSWLPRKTIGP